MNGQEGDWHLVSDEMAHVLIKLNESKTDAYTMEMVREFKAKLERKEEIKVPYNHPFLRLDDSQMKELGKLAEELRTAFYNKELTKTELAKWRKYLGCKQGCSFATYVIIIRGAILSMPYYMLVL